MAASSSSRPATDGAGGRLADGTAGEATARAFAARGHGVFVDGDLQALAGAEMIPAENPATEEPLAEVPVADDTVVDRAVAAARAAFDDGRWSRAEPTEQEAAMRRLAALVLEHGDELAWLEVLDNGKTMAEARGDVVSGLGRELGAHGLAAYTEVKSVFLAG